MIATNTGYTLAIGTTLETSNFFTPYIMVRIDKAQMTPDEIPTKKKPSEGLEDQGCKIKTNKAITN